MPTKGKTKKIEIEEEPKTEPSPSKGKYYYGCGKRKTAIAKVKLLKGTGEITINERPITNYFTVKTLHGIIKSPLTLTGNLQKFNIVAQIYGGGITSQAEALRHAIAKALTQVDPLNRPTLKKAGLLTRDSRIKERKKFGLKRARRAPQFSKR
ncbi:MAG: 30S ribosomal protein S9 [Patescibacteria group bacterium]|jgi:small subunit ribosomal protein S9